jgi:hypothetical protein
MTLSDMIAAIPAAEYRAACEAARLAAADANFGSQRAAKQFDSEIPHEVAGRIWDSNEIEADRLDLAVHAYAEMPCYGHAMYFSMNYRDLSAPVRERFWAWVRATLSGDDEALANPLQYMLWCDFFEADNERATESWSHLVDAESTDRLLQLVLVASGPAPYALKSRLYERLLPDRKWHYYIYRSIVHSIHDVYGSIDFYQAKQVLKQLDLPEETEGWAEVKQYMKNVHERTRAKRL